MSFGETLRKARKKTGKRQLDIAKEVGRKQPTVHSWEAGDSEPRTNLLPRIARAYKVNISVLMACLLRRGA